MRRFILAVGLVALVAAVVSGASIASKPGAGLPVHPAKSNFGRVAVGSFSQLSVTVTNNTDVTFTFADWIGFDEPSPFRLALSPDPGSDCTQVALAPGDTCAFTTTFSPTEAGHFQRSMDMVFRSAIGPGIGATWDVKGIGYTPKP
jgi:hypothetical protein